MRLVIENKHHDLRSGQCVTFGSNTRCESQSSYPSVRAMQRELLRRNRASIRAGKRCCILSTEGVYFYEMDTSYSYRTVQHVRLVP